MASRSNRTAVVLDTNVLVRNLKAKSNADPNRQIVRLWLCDRGLQLIVCSGILLEYLGVFEQVLGLSPARLEGWRQRFEDDNRCTVVGLSTRVAESRDPDDNVFLAAALAGRARYLVTNDRDLLEIPTEVQQGYPFRIVTPGEFLKQLRL